MPKRFSDELLRQLRNDIPMKFLVSRILGIQCKHSEGFLRFLCPRCREMRTAFNPRVNLARCFLCEKNFNAIDITMAARGYSFIEAAEYLQDLFESELFCKCIKSASVES